MDHVKQEGVGNVVLYERKKNFVAVDASVTHTAVTSASAVNIVTTKIVYNSTWRDFTTLFIYLCVILHARKYQD